MCRQNRGWIVEQSPARLQCSTSARTVNSGYADGWGTVTAFTSRVIYSWTATAASNLLRLIIAYATAHNTLISSGCFGNHRRRHGARTHDRPGIALRSNATRRLAGPTACKSHSDAAGIISGHPRIVEKWKYQGRVYGGQCAVGSDWVEAGSESTRGVR